MKDFLDRAAIWLPYVLAVVVPLAGFLYGLIQMSAGQRDEGLRLVGLSLIGAVLWVLVFTV